MKIRNATITDAEAIAKVHVDCWKTTYNGIIPEEYLEQLSYDQRTALWKKNIAQTDNYVYVAENNEGHLVGFADGGKRDTNKVENAGDVTSIYILEEFQGAGLGKKLLQKLFEKFLELEFITIFVEVLDDNKSKYFYEAFGATMMKSEKIKIAGKELKLLTYKWEDIRHTKITN